MGYKINYIVVVGKQMLVTQKKEGCFGKWQQLVSFLVLAICFQVGYIFMGFVPFFLLYFGCYKILAMLTVIFLVEMRARRSQRYIDFVLKYFPPSGYLRSMKRIFEEEIRTDQKYLFAFHPHGVNAYCILANMNYANDAMTGMIGLASRFVLNIPIMGFFVRLWGCQSVDAKNLKRLLKKGKVVGLLPGGFEEATLTTHKEFRVFINTRKGFIKYALKYNYTVYPTLTFNEHNAFWTLDYFTNIRLFMNKLKLPAVLFTSKFGFVFPPQTDLITVIGKGMKGRHYEEAEEPTTQEIEEFHKKYVSEIGRIYDTHSPYKQTTPIVFY